MSLVSVGISREILSLDDPQGALGKKPNKRRTRKEESEKKMQSKSGRSVAVSNVQNWDSLRDDRGASIYRRELREEFRKFFWCSFGIWLRGESLFVNEWQSLW